MKNSEITVGLLLGGFSPEREVSKLSAKSVLQALKDLQYKIKIIDPALGLSQPTKEEEYFLKNLEDQTSKENYTAAVSGDLFEGVDIVFNALHGTWGEDGTLQSLFEMNNIKYTGSGVLACALSMNKCSTKIMFEHFGVTTPKWILVEKAKFDLPSTKNRIEHEIKYPCVIKPNDQGSAIGLSICKDESEVNAAMDFAFRYSKSVLIEEYIEGYELTVGILNDTAFPPLEIKPKHSFYDYECKYTHGMSEYEVPAKFPAEVLNELKRQALLAFNAVGCTSYGRIDFRLSKYHKPYCLEVNTLPGLTSTSLLPKTAKADSISFEELVDHIIKNSL